MTELLTGITSQPNFPHEDLTDANADMIELILQNVSMVETNHQAVENVSLSFRISHPAIVWSAAKLWDDNQYNAALNYGVTTYEAINAIVAASGPSESDIPTTKSKLIDLSSRDLRSISEFRDGSIEDFKAQIPRTADVIQTSSRRFFGHLTTYALIGAAMSWGFQQGPKPVFLA